MGLHTAVHLIVVKVDAFMNVGLPYLIQSRIVEVLRFESSGINHGKTRIVALDNMLFNQLHDAAFLSCPEPASERRSSFINGPNDKSEIVEVRGEFPFLSNDATVPFVLLCCLMTQVHLDFLDHFLCGERSRFVVAKKLC